MNGHQRGAFLSDDKLSLQGIPIFRKSSSAIVSKNKKVCSSRGITPRAVVPQQRGQHDTAQNCGESVLGDTRPQ